MRKKAIFFVWVLVFIILAIVATSLGAAAIKPFTVVSAIIRKIPLLNNLIHTDISEATQLIIFKVRMPRIIMAGIVGVGLSVVGASFQSLFKNPMADPYVLGISSGTALGAAIAMIFKINSPFASLSFVTVAAFLGAVVTTSFVYNIAQVKGKVTITNLLLAGCSVSFLATALISIIMVFNQNEVNKIVFWMMGSLSASSWNNIYIAAPVVLIGSGIIFFFYRDLNIMLMGEEDAVTLGVETEVIKKIIVIVSSLIIAVCVSFSGIIGFVGFIIPHIVRILFGPNNKVLIPFSAVGGAIFLLFSDTIARTVAAPAELPVGAITALIGAPFFIHLLIKMKKRS